MKLLPCPFCGTNRTKLVQWPITTENWGAETRCECGCRGPSGFGKSSIPMACDLWNRREHSIERIKRLEEALRQIANQDYRGNRSTESQIALEALKESQ